MRIASVYLLMLSCVCFLKAQLNSVPSGEGVGIPVHQVANAFAGSPGLDATLSPHVGINFSNPATYSSISNTNFDLGMNVDNVAAKYNPAGIPLNYTHIRFTNIHIGLPILKKKLGLVLGVYPYSMVGYNLSFKQPVANSSVGDSVLTAVSATGGSYVIHAGLGYTINKYISVGFNIGYLWGSKNSTVRRDVFGGQLSSSSYSIYMEGLDLFYGGIYSSLGTVLTLPIGEEGGLKLGGTFSIPWGMSAYYDGIEKNAPLSAANIEEFDTITLIQKTPISLVMPPSYKMGLSYTNPGGNFSVGVKYEWTEWNTFSLLGKDVNVNLGYSKLQSDSYISLGLSFRPAKFTDTDLKGYFSYVGYSVGATFGSTQFREIQDNRDVQMFSVTAGLFFPLKRYSYSTQHGGISCNFTYTQQGFDPKNIFNTSIIGVQIGFTLGDLWFLKRKID